MLQKLKNLFIILLLSIFNSVFSQNIITDRPDQTESPNTLNKGNLQIESGYLYLKDRETNSKMNQSLKKIKGLGIMTVVKKDGDIICQTFMQLLVYLK